MSYKEILDNVSNIENLDNVTILKTLQKFGRAIRDFAEEQSGLENLLNVEFVPNDNAITYGDGVVDYLGNLKITLADNIIVNKPCNIKFNIKGSETIIVDVDEFDNALEIHLDSEIVSKINRSLLLPLNTPNELKLVGINTANSQTNLNLSNKFVEENGTIDLSNEVKTSLNFAESERQKSNTSGDIVHTNDLNKRVLIAGGPDCISLDNETFNDLNALFYFLLERPNSNFECSIGAQSNNSVKNLLGEPSGFANYTSLYITKVCETFESDVRDKKSTIYVCYALGAIVNKFAIGYLFCGSNNSNEPKFTGWNVLY